MSSVGGFQIPWDVVDPDGEMRRALLSRDGHARQALWPCKDGWIVGYTTERIEGGPFDGRFATMAYKPVGKGARTGDATEHVRVYYRGFNTRRSARARADALYTKHNAR